MTFAEDLEFLKDTCLVALAFVAFIASCLFPIAVGYLIVSFIINFLSKV